MQDISAENLRLTNFLLHILGMFPFSTDISTKNVTYIVYVICINFGFVFVVYVEIQGRVLTESGASMIIRSIASIILGFANVGLTVTINLNRKSKCEVIVDKLKTFDDFLVDNFYMKQKSSKAGVIVMIVIHVFHIYMIVAEVFMWKNVGWDVVLYNVVGNTLRYRLDIFVCCVYFFIKELHARIKYANQKLRNIIEKLRTNFKKKKYSIANTTFYMCQIPDITRNTSKAYATVTDVVEIFNKVFGWLLLVLMMNYLLVCIIAFSLGLRFKSLEEVNWIHLTWLISFTLGALVGAISISAVCNRSANEATKTGNLAYSLLSNITFKDRLVEDNSSLVEDLMLLIRQTTSHSPAFTAAGFFPVDYAGLFTLMNLLTSYVIVLIQFA